MTEQTEPRRWWPDFMCDECMPEPKDDPTAWLEIRNGTIVLGRLIDEDGGFNFEGIALTAGQVVEMDYCDFLGTRDVFLKEDGAFEVEDVPPEGFTYCWNRDEAESCADNLLELVASEREVDTSARTIDVGFVRWGHELFAVTLQDGKPGFDPVLPNASLHCHACGVVSTNGKCDCTRSDTNTRRAFRAEPAEA